MTTSIRIVKMSGVDCVGGVQRYWGLEYPFVWSDGGRAVSRRPKQSNDCTVRAVAIALNMSYDHAYDLLAGAGRKCWSGFDVVGWLAAQDWAEKIPFPAEKGRRRMNPAEFSKRFASGRYICRVAKHVFAVVDGVIHDSNEQRPDRCIYTAWRIKGLAEEAVK